MPQQLPILGNVGFISRLVGTSPSTIRRLAAGDPDCPRHFKFGERGDRQWLVQDWLDYLERKTGRPVRVPDPPSAA